MNAGESFPRSRPWLLGAVLLIAVWTLNTASSQGQTKQKVDVNSANVKTLETLPGITPALAHGIVEGRPYKNLKDLGKVQGMTNSKLNAIKKDIAFGSTPSKSKQTAAQSGGKSAKSGGKSAESDAENQQTAASAKATSTTAGQPPLPNTAKTKATEPTQPPSPTGASSGRLAPGQTVNINTATVEELDALPGIGPTKAQAIIDYRNEHGPFNSIDDIQNVKGIKGGEFSKLKDYIRVR